MKNNYYSLIPLLLILFSTGCSENNQSIKTNIAPLTIVNTETSIETPNKSIDPSTIDYRSYWAIYKSIYDGYSFAYPLHWYFSGHSNKIKPNWINICNYSEEFVHNHISHGSWSDQRIIAKAICITIVEFSGDNGGALLPLDQAVQLYTWPLDSTEGSVTQEWIDVHFPLKDDPNRVEFQYISSFGITSHQVAFRTITNSIILFYASYNNLPRVEIIAMINSTILDNNGIVELPKIIPGETLTDEMFR
jgi:hypothetical protein